MIQAGKCQGAIIQKYHKLVYIITLMMIMVASCLFAVFSATVDRAALLKHL